MDFFNIPSSDERNYRDGLYKDYNLIYENKIVQIVLLDTRFFKLDAFPIYNILEFLSRNL